jgi:type IV pilus assembly protein PilE
MQLGTRNARRVALGFTLIEVMMVVAVLGIISMVALPSYRDYLRRGNRSAAQQLMLNISNREEQYILDARAYTDVPGPAGLNIVQDGWTCSDTPATGCTNNFYRVTVAVTTGTPPTFTVTATPVASSYQASDGNMTLTSSGARTRSAGDGKW